MAVKKEISITLVGSNTELVITRTAGGDIELADPSGNNLIIEAGMVSDLYFLIFESESMLEVRDYE
jgi:hypothetical protein